MTASMKAVLLRSARRSLIAVAGFGIAVGSIAQELPNPYVDCSGGDSVSGCAVVEIGAATGVAGGSAEVDVALQVEGISVAGLQLDMVLPDVLSIGPEDCRVVPGFSKQLFAGNPPTGDRRLRGIIMSLTDVDPIPNGVVFRCTAAIAADAFPGRYPIDCDNAVGAGTEFVDYRVPAELFACYGGEVIVEHPIPTPTAIPDSRGEGRELVAGNGASGGCNVAPARHDGSTVLVLAATALLLVRRRWA